MEKISINIDSDDSFFCPFTGEDLWQEFTEDTAPESLVAIIHWEIPDEPIFIQEDIKEELEHFLEEENFKIDSLDKFLENKLDSKNTYIFTVTSIGFACGPVYETVTFVLKYPE